MSNEVTKPAKPLPPLLPEKVEKLLIQGDLKGLSPEERVVYYKSLCDSLGLNPLTKPFEYLEFQGKLQLYARKDCTEQLRKLYGVAITSVEDQIIGDVYRVKVTARDHTGRSDASLGAVGIKNLTGDALANAYMKAETKAKRRVTLSICGLGMLDETEVETVPGMRKFEEPRPLVRQSAKLPAPARAVLPASYHDNAVEPQTAEIVKAPASPFDDVFSGPPQEFKPQTTNNFEFLKKMEEQKKRIGEDLYYILLGQHGFEHANLILRREDQVRIYREIRDTPTPSHEPPEGNEEYTQDPRE